MSKKKTTAPAPKKKRSTPAQPTFLDAPAAIKSVTLRANNTAAELFVATGKDDSYFRNHERHLRSDSTPFIPKAAGGRRDGLRTIIGLIEYLETRETDRGLPRQVATMGDVEAVFHLPKEVQKHFREKGLCPDAWDASNRVHILPLLKAVGALLRQLLANGGGHLKDIPGFEELDKDIMQAKVLAQDEIRKKRENAQANKLLHTREEIEELIGESLSFLATALKNLPKNRGGQLKSLLQGAGVAPEIIGNALKIFIDAVEEPLRILRENHNATPKPDPQDAIEFFI